MLSIDEAAARLKAGEVVAFPTETVYGLGADATSREAVCKIFAAKGRPGDNPLIVHIGDVGQLALVAAEVPDTARALIDAFWPGPLTVILPKRPELPLEVTAGLKTVGVRMPSHPVALELLRKTGLPVAAPSANISGRPSPTTAQHVADDLGDKIAGVVDGGQAQIGLESTVIDCTAQPPVILRPGAVTKSRIEAVIGTVGLAAAHTVDAPKSPGMKYKHYAPRAPMHIVKGSDEFFRNVVAEARQGGKKVGILITQERRDSLDADVVLTCGTRADLSSVARDLYGVLREFDRHDIDVIYSESFDESGLGEAIMNRLRKAANDRVIKEN